MKKTTITRTKKLAAILFALVLSFCCMAIPSVNAETLQIETINAGQVWRESWPAAQEYAYLRVRINSTGFYTFNVTDNLNTNDFTVEVYDNTINEYLDYFANDYNYTSVSGSTYKTINFYFVSGHTYELVCSYFDYESDQFLAGDMSITVEKENITPIQIPNCEVSSSSLLLSLENGEYEWLKFKTSAAGDYYLNYSATNFGAFVDVYDVATGEEIYNSVDSEYYNYEDEEYLTKGRMAFALDANCEYYFRVNNYRDVTTKVAMVKASKDVTDITINDVYYDITCLWTDYEVEQEENFEYKVTFSDASTVEADINELGYNGYSAPSIYFLGKTIDLSGTKILSAGKQPIGTIYNDNASVSYIDITSVVEWLIEDDVDLTIPYYSRKIEYEDDLEHQYFWRFKTNESGFYGIQSYLDLPDVFRYYEIKILDKNNNSIQYNEKEKAWPLVAGQDYAVSIMYCYDERYTYADVTFWFEKDDTKLFPDTHANTWYYDFVAYTTGRGIITGYGNGNFGVSDGIQRQDFLVILARLDGVDLDDYKGCSSNFPDVAADSYYEAAVNWGYENGIVNGYDNGKFGVGDKITREQLVTFLRRYAEYRYTDSGYSTQTAQQMKNTYRDYGRISLFALDSVIWAVEKGIIKGKTTTTIDPQGYAQRCEIATIMYNIFDKEIF